MYTSLFTKKAKIEDLESYSLLKYSNYNDFKNKDVFDLNKFIHSSLDVITTFTKQIEYDNLMTYLPEYANKYYSKSKNDAQRFLNMFFNSLLLHSQTHKEVLFHFNLYNSLTICSLKSKLYLKFRKIIIEFLYLANRCKNIDNIFLTMNQWVGIVSRIFTDNEPTDKINHLMETMNNNEKILSKNNLNCIALIELCMMEYFQSKEIDFQEKIIKKQTIIPKESKIMSAENSAKLEIENLKLELSKANKDKELLLEFCEVISNAYQDLLSYTYHLEKKNDSLLELAKQKKSSVFENLNPQEINDMQLQIYYMTLIESRDILRKEGLIKSPERFSDFLETVGSKSFKEKNENFNRYDKNQKYRDLFKDKKEQKIEKKIELQSPVKLGATQMRRDSDGELNSQENSEDRKSKESLSDREDIN